MSKILFTGVTGFIGRHLLLEYYTHTDSQLYCLLRPTQDDSLGRIFKSLSQAAQEAGVNISSDAEISQRVRVFEWDLCTPLDFDACQNWFDGKVDTIWHLAAKLGFADSLTTELMQTNQGGTESLIDLARSNDAILNYVSTAYTSGTLVGHIPEILHSKSIPTNNPYEDSKRAAEETIIDARIKYRIFRPTIVVGHSITGAGNSPFGYYGFLTIASKMCHEVENKVPLYFDTHPITLFANPAASLNLIPVDTVVSVIRNVAEKPDSIDRIFHVASDASVSIVDICAIAEKNLGMKLVITNNLDDLNAIDLLIHDRVKEFQSYLGEPKQFSLDNTNLFLDPTINISKLSAEFVKLITDKFYERYHERDRAKQQSMESIFQRMERKVIPGLGDRLNYFVGGNGATPLVILNAYGQSLYFWNWLLTDLFDDFKIYIWQMRGTASGEGGMSTHFTFADHLIDLEDVFKHEKIKHATIMAWCSGAKLALEFYHSRPEKVDNMIFIAAAFKGLPKMEDLLTPYEQNMDPICRMVGENPRLAANLKNSLKLILADRSETFDPNQEMSNSQAQIRKVLSVVDPRLKPLLIAPFLSEASIVAYANQLLDFWSHDVSAIIPQVQIPVLLLAGEFDDIASSEISRRVAGLLPQAIYSEIPHGTHYLHYDNHEVINDRIREFIQKYKPATP
jgi:nucleoside-diphosphate-sugar epimerase/pimeloyl-ACP methyl ester carboxylesterase